MRTGLMSANFEMQELDDRTRAGVAEVCQLMSQHNISFDEARLQLVLNRMNQMGVDESGMPTDPKTFTFDQVRSRGEVPTPWRREKQPRSLRHCSTYPGAVKEADTPKGDARGFFGASVVGRVLHEVRRLDPIELPMSVTDTKASKMVRAGLNLGLAARVMVMAAFAFVAMVLYVKEGGAALPGQLVQLPEDPSLVEMQRP
mmetsp:Transcript_97488/g.271293  ORF Transcript_97488/g.271293 Transcript_97488/m.271293 type:complete len:201 (-) Transcript_97488:185-787(-)